MKKVNELIESQAEAYKNQSILYATESNKLVAQIKGQNARSERLKSIKRKWDDQIHLPIAFLFSLGWVILVSCNYILLSDVFEVEFPNFSRIPSVVSIIISMGIGELLSWSRSDLFQVKLDKALENNSARRIESEIEADMKKKAKNNTQMGVALLFAFCIAIFYVTIHRPNGEIELNMTSLYPCFITFLECITSMFVLYVFNRLVLGYTIRRLNRCKQKLMNSCIEATNRANAYYEQSKKLLDSGFPKEVLIAVYRSQNKTAGSDNYLDLTDASEFDQVTNQMAVV